MLSSQKKVIEKIIFWLKLLAKIRLILHIKSNEMDMRIFLVSRTK